MDTDNADVTMSNYDNAFTIPRFFLKIKVDLAPSRMVSKPNTPSLILTKIHTFFLLCGSTNL